ncbi:hypothetical protein, partial [Thiolapillus sp.]
MTRTAGAQIGCQRPSRFWGLGCPKIYHEAEDTLVLFVPIRNAGQVSRVGLADSHSILQLVCPGQVFLAVGIGEG